METGEEDVFAEVGKTTRNTENLLELQRNNLVFKMNDNILVLCCWFVWTFFP